MEEECPRCGETDALADVQVTSVSDNGTKRLLWSGRLCLECESEVVSACEQQ